ncbi:elongation factor 1 alpha-like protein [Marchantia polymorpha subsp. ruderalis]|uniref:Tr-type G domain-containing protein n=2 Tax=Marchantia polymorpha TaxID=3197 RepID=A0AAF6B501_MARPO|nr:hypothetical protein MARPO_0066s0056 [Marchantia polymorpha]BBN07085.1 hypothetical protein Mp_4g00870 [Marchantia polymorpha subsp. ruderalis]|eukprot:PTQ36098.1 hypothetical protein MARPO_0066s0056 [Marchantia polymorpha]
MPRKFNRSINYDDEDDGYDDYDDYYDDDDEEAPSSVKAPVKAAAVKSKDVAKTVEAQPKKPKASANLSNVGSSNHKEASNAKLKAAELGASPKEMEGAEPQVLEGIMHMTLEGDYRERGKGREQTPALQKPIEAFIPESWILEEIKQERKPLLHLIVIGHVDAGKSTLMGHILHLLGRVSQKEMHKNERESKQKGKGSFAYAWVLDEGSEERARGVTMTVAVAHFETPKLRVVLLDAPGHRDFVPNMISGAAQADAAVLVVDASLGAFEAGLDGEGQSGGQTREHAQLVRSLGVEQLIVAVNKMDAVNYSQKRYDFIKGSLHSFLRQCGFKEAAISWIPVCAMEGENLIAPPSAPALKSWYSGPTLMESVDSFEQPLRNTLKPFRLIVAELVKTRSLGQAAVSGKLESGALRIGSKVLVMPIGEIATVKAIEQDGHPLTVALAGDSVDVGLTGVEPAVLISGGVLCHPDYPVPVVTKLEIRVLILGITVPILRGGQVVLHAHHARESAKVAELVALLDSKSGAVVRKKPRCLTANQSALIEIIPERSMCLEVYSQFKALGRIALRDGGKTLAVGIITRIISCQ